MNKQHLREGRHQLMTPLAASIIIESIDARSASFSVDDAHANAAVVEHFYRAVGIECC